MPDHHPTQVQPLLLEDAELVEPDLALHGVRADGESGPGRGARHGAKDALLARAHPGVVGAYLADDPRMDARPLHAMLELGHDLAGQVVDGTTVDASLGRVEAVSVPPGAHHDEDPAPRREVAQPDRVARQSAAGQIDQAAAAAAAEVVQLVGHHLGV